jgi:hypothetical protein
MFLPLNRQLAVHIDFKLFFRRLADWGEKSLKINSQYDLSN